VCAPLGLSRHLCCYGLGLRACFLLALLPCVSVSLSEQELERARVSILTLQSDLTATSGLLASYASEVDTLRAMGELPACCYCPPGVLVFVAAATYVDWALGSVVCTFLCILFGCSIPDAEHDAARLAKQVAEQGDAIAVLTGELEEARSSLARALSDVEQGRVQAEELRRQVRVCETVCGTSLPACWHVAHVRPCTH
jgi:hypothetical protein